MGRSPRSQGPAACHRLRTRMRTHAATHTRPCMLCAPTNAAHSRAHVRTWRAIRCCREARYPRAILMLCAHPVPTPCSFQMPKSPQARVTRPQIVLPGRLWAGQVQAWSCSCLISFIGPQSRVLSPSSPGPDSALPEWPGSAGKTAQVRVCCCAQMDKC